MRISQAGIWILVIALSGITDLVKAQDETDSACGGDFIGEIGVNNVLTSPNFGEGNYNADEICEYNFIANEGEIITIIFTDFDVEAGTFCNYDFLEILGTSYCGTDAPPTIEYEVSSPDDTLLTMTFTSDASVTESGWRLEWVVLQKDDQPDQPACQFPFQYQGEEYNHCIDNENSGQMWCSTTYDYDTDGEYINCPSQNLNEAFMIKYVNYNHPDCVFPFEYYGVTFMSCVTVNSTTPWCSTTSFFEVGSGTYETCTLQDPPTTTSSTTASTATTTTTTATTTTATTTTATTTTATTTTATTTTPTTESTTEEFVLPGCGGTFIGEVGVTNELTSPNFGEGNYNADEICEYNFIADEGDVIQITFTDFDVEPSAFCNYDFVEILGNKYCGTDAPPTIEHEVSSPDDTLLRMTFTSDASVVESGWRLEWVVLREVATTTTELPTTTEVDAQSTTELPETTTTEVLTTSTTELPTTTTEDVTTFTIVPTATTTEVFSTTTEEETEGSCPAETGWCVTAAGEDQHQTKLTHADGSIITDRDECLQKCKDYPGATGCEFIWDAGEYSSCYVHLHDDIVGGNNMHNHLCWVFSNCDWDTTTTTTSTTSSTMPSSSERFFTTSFEMSFEEAKAYCEQNGASLLQVQNEVKFDEIISWMTSNQYENWFWTGMEYTNEGPILTDGNTAYIQWVPEAPHSLDDHPDNTKLMIQSTGNWNWSPHPGNNGKPLCETPEHDDWIGFDGFYGDWGAVEMCPDGGFVYGYSLKSEENQGEGDDTALNAVKLVCGNGYDEAHITSTEGEWGSYSTPVSCSGGHQNPITGFRMQIEGEQGIEDDTVANNLHMHCSDGEILEAGAATSWGDLTDYVTCPPGQAVTGIQTRVEAYIGEGDDTSLNGVRLFCSDFHYSPEGMPDLHCDQYEVLADSCSMRQAWLCQYTEWRFNFFATWLGQFLEHNNAHSLMDAEMPTCALTEDMIHCKHAEMKVCYPSALPDCPVCFCSDHQYTNVNEIRGAWSRDYQTWNEMMRTMQTVGTSAGSNDNDSC